MNYLKSLTTTAFIIFILALFLTPTALAAQDDEAITMRFFWGEGCPHCEAQKTYNERLLEDHPYLVIESYEVYRSYENQRIYRETAAEYGVAAQGVPATFIEGHHWLGFTERSYLEMNETISALALNRTVEKPADTMIRLPLIGEIDLTDSSLLLATLTIAFIDGFNPCSLWLLTFLLGVLILSRSRRKMIIVGTVFLTVTAAAYGAFIVGLFSIFQFTAYLGYIRWFVGLLALTFGLVNIKDYFWYKKGLSFTISDEQKPGLFKKVRGIMRPDQSTLGMVLATVVLALGVTLVELPCTAGFPVIWSSLVALESPELVKFIALLALYLLIYLSIEITILVSAIISFTKLEFTEAHGRILKLFGGMIMLLLAMGFIFAYEFMNTIQGMLMFMGAAIIASTFIIVIHGFVRGEEKTNEGENPNRAAEREPREPEESP